MGMPTSMTSGDQSWKSDDACEDGSRDHVGGDSDGSNSGEDGEGGD